MPETQNKVALPLFPFRGLLLVATTALVVLVLQVAFESTKTARHLPEHISFIPAESEAFFITSSLDGLWSNYANHTGRFATSEIGEFWEEVNNFVLSGVSERCILAGNLSALGLDMRRGATFATSGPLTSLPLSKLIALPVGDAETALEALEPLFFEAVDFDLTAVSSQDDIIEYRITPTIENGRLCLGQANAPLSGDVVSMTSGRELLVPIERGARSNIVLHFAPGRDAPARVSLACEAETQSGQLLPCSCNVRSSARNQPCAWPFETARFGEGIAALSETDENFIPDGRDWLWAPTDDGWLVLSNDIRMMRTSLANRDDAKLRFLGDGGLRQLVDQYHSYGAAGAGTVFGMLPGLLDPVSTAVPFALTADAGTLSLNAVLPLDTFNTQLLDDLVSHVEKAPDWRMTEPLAMRLNDPSLSTYYKIAKTLANPPPEEPETGIVLIEEIAEPDRAITWWPECAASSAEGTQDAIGWMGNFSPLIEGISREPEIGTVELYVTDVRDGVPEVVMVLNDQNAQMISRLVHRTQIEMLSSRDTRILCEARLRYWEQSGAPVFPVFLDTLAPYLGDESERLLGQYDLQGARVKENRAFHRAHNPGDATSGLQLPNYRTNLDGIDITYLPPPISDNDLNYRIAVDPEAVDIDALKNNEFRLAHVLLPDGTAVFGTDAQTLVRFLTADHTIRPELPQTGLAEDKAAIRANPEYLASLGLLHPDQDVRNLISTDGLGVLDQYQNMEVYLRPSTRFRGLLLEMRLSHE